MKCTFCEATHCRLWRPLMMRESPTLFCRKCLIELRNLSSDYIEANKDEFYLSNRFVAALGGLDGLFSGSDNYKIEDWMDWLSLSLEPSFLPKILELT